jgi:thiol-disulfide isomerase/thioredoxin
MRPRSILGILIAIYSVLTAGAAEQLLRTHPSEWQATNWFNSPPLQLKGLRGKVVLVRWWTAPECPYCKATAPALNEFYKKYHGRGLEIVGFYHHKSEEPLNAAIVKEYAKQFGFKFPIATDLDWKTLQSWWLDGHPRGWTSVSFLLDRHGAIRHIHPGGQYIKGDANYTALKAKIEELLAEK